MSRVLIYVSSRILVHPFGARMCGIEFLSFELMVILARSSPFVPGLFSIQKYHELLKMLQPAGCNRDISSRVRLRPADKRARVSFSKSAFFTASLYYLLLPKGWTTT